MGANPLGQTMPEQPVAPVAPPMPAPTTMPVPPVQPEPQQPVVASSPIPTPTVMAPSAPLPMPGTPRKGGNKKLMLLIILLILMLGMAVYVFFVKNQVKKSAINNSASVAVPTIVVTPTIAEPATVGDIYISSPEADLKSLETDVLGL